MKAVSPVIKGLEEFEMVIAKDQPGVEPLPALRSPDGIVMSRWHPTEEERTAIARGEDIFILTHTFNNPLQAMSLQVGEPPKTRTLVGMRLADTKELIELRNVYLEAQQRLKEAEQAFQAKQQEVNQPQKPLVELIN